MYFSSNNNSSSNGTLGSLQKTLNNLKLLKTNNTMNSTEPLTQIDNMILNKLLESNQGFYKDIFNKTELDLQQLKNESIKNISLNITPTFSSFGMSENENFINSFFDQTNKKYNINKFFPSNQELNIIYEENKVENLEKDDLNLFE